MGVQGHIGEFGEGGGPEGVEVGGGGECGVMWVGSTAAPATATRGLASGAAVEETSRRWVHGWVAGTETVAEPEARSSGPDCTGTSPFFIRRSVTGPASGASPPR